MSYEAVMEQIKLVPEEYLGEISEMISFILHRHQHNSPKACKDNRLGEFFGVMDLGEGLAIQKEIRGEWN